MRSIVNKLKNSLFKSERNRIFKNYINGMGIEIGALHNPLRLPRNVKVQYVDRLSTAELRKQYPELNAKALVNVDIVTDGETLEGIKNCSQDFIVANHFLEHCQNPISAVENMVRVLKESGILFMAVPDKRYTFDKDRPVTPLEHLINDYENGPGRSKEDHFLEWVKLIEKKTDEQVIQQRLQNLRDIDYSIHFHVWTQFELLELMLYLKKKLVFEIEMVLRNNTEIIVVIRKSESGGP